MKPAETKILRDLMEMQEIAALGTLHNGEPFVSMVPFAIVRGSADFVIHVSQLAAHTKDMLLSPQVSLLIVAPPAPDVSAQATARATIQGHARPCAASSEGHAGAKAAYLARFPDSAGMFEFADFSLFLIRPTSIRLVGGFAQARTLAPEAFAEALSRG